MSFENIVGQKRVIQILRKMLQSEHLPQALLFYGPSGVGKRTIALELAKTLNCQTRGDACDNCLSCQKIHKGIHPDVRIILPEKDTLTIDQIRDLIRETQWKPLEAKWKVYILENAEKLNQEAANCLLKTLEEPPPKVLIILLTQNREVLLPTIVSRCWCIGFAGLSEQEIYQILGQKYADYLSLPVEEVRPFAKLFAGSTQELLIEKKIFIELYTEIEKIWQNINLYNYAEILDTSEKYSKNKEETNMFLTLFLLSARQKGLWEVMNFIHQAKIQIQRNLNRQLVLDCLFFKLKEVIKCQ